MEVMLTSELAREMSSRYDVQRQIAAAQRELKEADAKHEEYEKVLFFCLASRRNCVSC